MSESLRFSPPSAFSDVPVCICTRCDQPITNYPHIASHAPEECIEALQSALRPYTLLASLVDNGNPPDAVIHITSTGTFVEVRETRRLNGGLRRSHYGEGPTLELALAALFMARGLVEEGAPKVDA